MDIYYRAALAIDSLCLSTHWIYDESEIQEKFPSGLKQPTAPLSQYHQGKVAGDLTHYGDQTIILKNSIEHRGGFSEEHWRQDWLDQMYHFSGYMDGASRQTITSEGLIASDSQDLGGAARIAPLFDLGMNLESTVAAAVAQTKLTHGDPIVSQAAEFFTRVTFKVQEGASIPSAVREISKTHDETLMALKPESIIAKLEPLLEKTPSEAAASLGKACNTNQAFPLAIYFLLQGHSFAETMEANALAGGDNSARGNLMALPFAAQDAHVADALAAHVNTLKVN